MEKIHVKVDDHTGVVTAISGNRRLKTMVDLNGTATCYNVETSQDVVVRLINGNIVTSSIH